MVWEQLQKIAQHLAGKDARLIMIDQEKDVIQVIVPNSSLVHHMYVYEDLAQLKRPINSMFSYTVAECTLTPDGEIILN